MIEIRNLLFQPLTFQLAGVEEGLHIHSREIRQILEEHVSEEILSAAARGFVELTGLGASEQAETRDSSSDSPGNEDLPADAPMVEQAVQPTEGPVTPEPPLLTEEPVMMEAAMLAESAAEVVESTDAGAETADSTDTTTTRKRR